MARKSDLAKMGTLLTGAPDEITNLGEKPMQAREFSEVTLLGSTSVDGAVSKDKTPSQTLEIDKRLENFPEELKPKMINAINEVYNKLLAGDECVDVHTRKELLESIKKAKFIYKPDLDKEVGSPTCGYAPWHSLVTYNDLYIGPRAFSKAQGCDNLSQIVIHELAHLKWATETTASKIGSACFPDQKITK